MKRNMVWRAALPLVVLCAVVLAGCPSPEPGPGPEPTPIVVPLPDSVVVVYESGDMTVQRAAVLYSDEVRDLLAGRVYVLDKDIVDATGEQPDWLKAMVSIANQEGLPQVFVVRNGSIAGYFLMPESPTVFVSKVKEIYGG